VLIAIRDGVKENTRSLHKRCGLLTGQVNYPFFGAEIFVAGNFLTPRKIPFSHHHQGQGADADPSIPTMDMQGMSSSSNTTDSVLSIDPDNQPIDTVK